jgi:transposase
MVSQSLDDYVSEDNAARVIDVYVENSALSLLGFKTRPNETGRPDYNPATMLKLYVYGYMSRSRSSRRLGRKAQRNVEPMWLSGRLAAEFKTLSDFGTGNGEAIRQVCRRFVFLCRKLNLCAGAVNLSIPRRKKQIRH